MWILYRWPCDKVTHGCWAPAMRQDLSSNVILRTGSGSRWHTAPTVQGRPAWSNTVCPGAISQRGIHPPGVGMGVPSAKAMQFPGRPVWPVALQRFCDSLHPVWDGPGLAEAGACFFKRFPPSKCERGSAGSAGPGCAEYKKADPDLVRVGLRGESLRVSGDWGYPDSALNVREFLPYPPRVLADVMQRPTNVSAGRTRESPQSGP